MNTVPVISFKILFAGFLNFFKIATVLIVYKGMRFCAGRLQSSVERFRTCLNRLVIMLSSFTRLKIQIKVVKEKLNNKTKTTKEEQKKNKRVLQIHLL